MDREGSAPSQQPQPRPKKPRSAKAEARRAAALAEQAAYDASWLGWIEANPALAAAMLAAAGGLAFLVWRYAPWRSLRASSAAGGGAKGKRKGQRKINTGTEAASSSGAAGSASSNDESDRAASPVTPVGFKNVGNTCFLNALLQVCREPAQERERAACGEARVCSANLGGRSCVV